MAQDTSIGVAQQMMAGMMNKANGLIDLRVDPLTVREPKYHVYVFTVAPRSFVVRQPPLLCKVDIPAKRPEEKYRKVCSFPDIVLQSRQDPNSDGQLEIRTFYGENVAMSLCNPGNTTLDQDQEFRPDDIMQGENLTKWGVFWSLNKVPTDAEVARATERLEKNLRALIDEAESLHAQGPNFRPFIHENHHIAAKYFAYQGPWNTVVSVPVECPNCGDKIRKGAAFHRTEDGVVCVIDWKRTVAAGVKSKKEVPEELRWWEDEKPNRVI